jgi:hypothetical protein
MMQDVCVKSIPVLSRQKQNSERKRNFSPEKLNLKFKEEASKMLFLD